jgi:hypothetical protein
MQSFFDLLVLALLRITENVLDTAATAIATAVITASVLQCC